MSFSLPDRTSSSKAHDAVGEENPSQVRPCDLRRSVYKSEQNLSISGYTPPLGTAGRLEARMRVLGGLHVGDRKSATCLQEGV